MYLERPFWLRKKRQQCNRKTARKVCGESANVKFAKKFMTECGGAYVCVNIGLQNTDRI